MYKWINLLIVWGVIWNKRMLGHPCSSQHPQLLPSVYQAALNHAGPYGHARAISHTPWEAVTFVAVSAVIGAISKKKSHVFSANFKMSYVGSLLETESTAVHRRRSGFKKLP